MTAGFRRALDKAMQQVLLSPIAEGSWGPVPTVDLVLAHLGSDSDFLEAITVALVVGIRDEVAGVGEPLAGLDVPAVAGRVTAHLLDPNRGP